MGHCFVFSVSKTIDFSTHFFIRKSQRQLFWFLWNSFPDLTLKVWRVYPFASEALAPLFMFMSHLPATHLMFAHYSLGVVYQDSSKSSYIFSMFRTENPKSGNFFIFYLVNYSQLQLSKNQRMSVCLPGSSPYLNTFYLGTKRSMGCFLPSHPRQDSGP